MTAIAPGFRIGARKAERFAVFACADAKYSGAKHRLRVHDLSLSGVRVETKDRILEAGDWIRLQLPIVGEQLGQVIWHRGRTSGVQFAHDLSREDLTRALNEMRD